MKKKWIANSIMVAIIVAIAAAGVITVGSIQGWFDTDDGSMAVMDDMRGVIRMERDGVSYKVEGETILRAGDRITCDPGASTVIRVSDSTLTLAERADLVITDPAADHFDAQLNGGEIFANCQTEVPLTMNGHTVVFRQAIAHVSVRSGAQSISVLHGTVENATAGQMLEYISEEVSVRALDIRSLNDFTINSIRALGDTASLCFTSDDLDQLETDRLAALEALLQTPTRPTVPEPDVTESASATTPVTTSPTETGNSTGQTPSTQTPSTQTPSTQTPSTQTPSTQTPSTQTPSTQTPSTQTPSTQTPAVTPTTPPTGNTETTPATENTETTPATENTEPAATTAPPETTAPEETTEQTEPPAPVKPVIGSCSITIRCDTILNNMADLNPAKAAYVPADGVILPVVRVDLYEGDTAFDVLMRVCKATSTQLEYRWSMYGSYYIEGINHLYEFDCGGESGWMFKVNEWFPNYGCSSYTLKDGDVIAFLYTCKGLGTDVGAPEYKE